MSNQSIISIGVALTVLKGNAELLKAVAARIEDTAEYLKDQLLKLEGVNKDDLEP
ncbi:hypothetical protein LCGC14_2896330 [marine sediment metagenome]|uniref:Uncharacterized protein n=1 Tax=marine sediment metagenome TaxID=412755 RepID=A0A0F8XW44_9ZZZZ